MGNVRRRECAMAYCNRPSSTSCRSPESVQVNSLATLSSSEPGHGTFTRVLGGAVILRGEAVRRQAGQLVDPHELWGSPAPDEPGVTVANYEPGDTTSIFVNLRVADIQACYAEWKSKRPEFSTARHGPARERHRRVVVVYIRRGKGRRMIATSLLANPCGIA
jgi:hypothetical protein